MVNNPEFGANLQREKPRRRIRDGAFRTLRLMLVAHPRPIYQDLDRALAAADAAVGVAEAHGMLCAQLCVPQRFDAGAWREDVFGADPGAPAAVDRCSALLAQLESSTRAAFDRGDSSLCPLLPDAARKLSERVSALGLWCQGFAYGFGLTGMNRLELLSPDSREFLSDLEAISRVDAAAVTSDETDEDAYADLVQYIRLGALSLHADLGRLGERTMESPA